MTQKQRAALRLWCQWNLGDADWAQEIEYALEHPEDTKTSIIEQMKEN